jgi:putative salt-induced outer membrane protein
MPIFRVVLCVFTVSSIATSALAQATGTEPPPLWDSEVGASFVGNSGNSDTTTIGAEFKMHRRWPEWQIESTASAVRTADRGARTAERYLGAFRGRRQLTEAIGVTAGERAERDRLAGIDFRSIFDVGLTYAVVQQPRWTLDGLTSLAWNHENALGQDRDDPVGVLQLLSRTPFSATADSTQRITFYPDFKTVAAYRSEAEIAVQAAINSRLALKVGYLWRHSNAPVLGFVPNDNTATASIVVHWKAAIVVPAGR